MFTEWASELRDRRVDVDRGTLLEAIALRDQLDAFVSEALGEFDAAKLWDVDAATSMTAWLRTHAGMTSRRAGREAGLARRLHDLPVVREAWRDGRLSGGQVEAIMAMVPAGHRRLFAEHEADLVPVLEPLTVEDTARAMEYWVAHADNSAGDGGPAGDAEPPRSLHLSRLPDGRGRVDGNLDPDTFALLQAALRVASSRGVGSDPARTPAEQRTDDLGDICKFFLDNQTAKPGGRHRPHLNVVLDLEAATARYVDGPSVTRQAVEALLCDGALSRVLRSGRSAILDYGMATRVITAALWMALAIRDEHCRWDGCNRPATWCDAHHVVWFSEGGETRLDNLVLLCRRHHRKLHQPGWHAKLLPDATFEVTDPAGLVRTSHPPGALRPFG